MNRLPSSSQKAMTSTVRVACPPPRQRAQSEDPSDDAVGTVEPATVPDGVQVRPGGDDGPVTAAPPETTDGVPHRIDPDVEAALDHPSLDQLLCLHPRGS